MSQSLGQFDCPHLLRILRIKKYAYSLRLSQQLQAQTMQAIFKENLSLCNNVPEDVVQHVVRCIQTHGRYVQYINFLQSVVKAEGLYIRRSQDLVMSEVCQSSSSSENFVNCMNVSYRQLRLLCEIVCFPGKLMSSGYRFTNRSCIMKCFFFTLFCFPSTYLLCVSFSLTLPFWFFTSDSYAFVKMC